MNLTQLNAKRFSQEELMEFVKLLIDSVKGNPEMKIEDPIALKYLETLERDLTELENTNNAVLSDEKNKLLQELDRQRDKQLLIFRRLMQVHELSDDNSPEAIAYEELNQLWMKKYETLPYLNMAVETTGIESLLFDLSADKYTDYIELLGLSEIVENIKVANDKFKIVYTDISDESSFKPTYDARSLRIDLTDTVILYMNYVQALADSSYNEEMKSLHQSVKTVSQNYLKQIAERHSGIPISAE